MGVAITGFFIFVKIFCAMISILIPERNFDCRQLVTELASQCSIAAVKHEIIVMDDCSSLYLDENREINRIPGCILVEQNQHLGAAKARNRLAGMAKYPFLLMLDCDALVPGKSYIQMYLDHIGKADVIVGGLAYSETKPDKDHMLRWWYGRHRECIPAAKRNEDPYQSLLSFQFLIRKDILLKYPFEETVKDYGHEDTILGHELSKHGISILYIDNPLIHVGLDTNAVFLQKSLMAARKYLSNPVFRDKQLADRVRLFRIFANVRRYKLNFLVRILFILLRPLMKRNLQGGRPYLFVFDFYRLGYLCLLNNLELKA